MECGAERLCVGGHRCAAAGNGLLPVLLTIALVAADSASAQSVVPTWETGQYAASATRNTHLGTAPSSGGTSDLSRLSDEELIDLYVAAYSESLRTLVADDAALVDADRFLLQVGYTFGYRDVSEFHQALHTVPELLLRYRLLERVELRLAWAGATIDGLTDEVSGVTDWDTDLSDPSVGVRVAISAQRGWLPRTSVTASSPLHVDSDVALVNRFDPFVGLGYSWFCNNRWLLSGDSALVWTYEGDERFLDFQQSVSLDLLLGQRWGLSAEWTGLFPEGARVDGSRHTLGPGVTYSLTRNLQLDWLTLFGLDDVSPDVLTQLLLSWRF